MPVPRLPWALLALPTTLLPFLFALLSLPALRHSRGYGSAAQPPPAVSAAPTLPPRTCGGDGGEGDAEEGERGREAGQMTKGEERGREEEVRDGAEVTGEKFRSRNKGCRLR